MGYTVSMAASDRQASGAGASMKTSESSTTGGSIPRATDGETLGGGVEVQALQLTRSERQAIRIDFTSYSLLGKDFPDPGIANIWLENKPWRVHPVPVRWCHMSLTRDDVVKLADLARMQLTDTELSSAEHELDAILSYVHRLQAIDTQGVEPLTMPAKSEDWRDDAALPCDDLTRELLLSNFPARRGDLLSAPAVFANPKGGK